MRGLAARRLREFRRRRDDHRTAIALSKAQIQDNLEQLVGKLAIAWALMELNLDRVIETFHRNGAAEAIQADLPVNMKPKLRYLWKARLLLDGVWHEKIERICQDAHHLKQVRTDLMHGVAGEYQGKIGGWTFARSDFEKSSRTEVHSQRSLTAITDAILSVVKLNNRVSMLVILVADQFDPKNARNRNR